MKLAIPIPLTELCRLAEVSRAGFYRWRNEGPVEDADMELRDAIQRIAVEWPCYGSRRITRELLRRGRRVNRKKVQRLMREDNLLCLRKRRFVVTTDSDHGLPVYPNVARDLVLTESISYGWPTSPTSGWRRSSCIWRWCWMRSHAK